MRNHGPVAECMKTAWNVEWGICETDTEFGGGKKRQSLLLFTLYPCWKCCALLLFFSTNLLRLMNRTLSLITVIHTNSVWRTWYYSNVGPRKAAKQNTHFLILCLHLRKDLELIELITGLDVGDWNFAVVLQFDLTVVLNFNLVHVRVWIESVLSWLFWLTREEKLQRVGA